MKSAKYSAFIETLSILHNYQPGKTFLKFSKYTASTHTKKIQNTKWNENFAWLSKLIPTHVQT